MADRLAEARTRARTCRKSLQSYRWRGCVGLPVTLRPLPGHFVCIVGIDALLPSRAIGFNQAEDRIRLGREPIVSSGRIAPLCGSPREGPESTIAIIPLRERNRLHRQKQTSATIAAFSYCTRRRLASAHASARHLSTWLTSRPPDPRSSPIFTPASLIGPRDATSDIAAIRA